MRRCPPIADHGMVGDLQTAALVSSEGVVDWICAPRFDSPSLFAALPDHDRGGHFAITVDGTDVTTRQLYPAGTAVLITRCLTPRSRPSTSSLAVEAASGGSWSGAQ
jgi:GH15 family glucan-1,4-alpha-glucosidase